MWLAQPPKTRQQFSCTFQCENTLRQQKHSASFHDAPMWMLKSICGNFGSSTSCAFAVALMVGFAASAPSAQGQTFTLLYTFAGGADGAQPMGLVRDSAGNLYGTTLYGGGGRCSLNAGCGTIFKLDDAGNETVLHAFTGGKDGTLPWATLIPDAAGNLFGATLNGGNLQCGVVTGCGTIFKLDATGKKTVLYSFPSLVDGALPYGVVRDAKGNFYGTTAYGGTGDGTVFKVDATGKETVLHSFAGGPDGSGPYAGVVRDKAGNLFGTTYGGTIFKVDSTGKETVLHTFSGTDGAGPIGSLMPYGENLYGTTSSFGEFGYLFDGTVFMLNKTGEYTVVYNFADGTDGGSPTGNLIHDAAGILYGVTNYGGDFGRGTVFKVDPATGAETVLYSFTGGRS